ncbi:MAG: putative DNA binding domain-containing protein [Bacilli bacterium]|nr:putative DNA binding domain-containing protein [Bacilli bacterium]
MFESETVEFKERLNDKFEKEVVGFLNTTKGGSLYIGLDDEGHHVDFGDLDLVELQIKDRIKNNISPSPLGLFEIVTPDNGEHVQIVISGGNQRPYYIKKYGMCPEGCYIRVGTSVEKMSEEMILSLFQKRDKRTLRNIVSDNQNLTFNYLRNAYQEKGFDVGDNFLRQLELYCQDGQYNKLAYLLSDQFAPSFQYAKYDGNDVFDLVENKDFSNQSILKSALEILEFIESKNVVYTTITSTGRVDVPRVNMIAVRELVVNAIVHNDYRGDGMPTFEEFSNRLEISSFGGLPDGFTKEDFLNGYSLPVNPELIRVFRDLGFAERLGTGIRRVLRYYPKEIFGFSPSFLRVNIPFALRVEEDKNVPLFQRIMSAIKDNPFITRKALSLLLGKSESTIYRELSSLSNKGLIQRVGGNKDGHWVVVGDE